MIPRYQRVRLELEKYLANLPLGSRIMTEHELAVRFKISRVTARKALQSLRSEGILQSSPGRGTFLVKPPPSTESFSSRAKLLGLLVPSVESAMIAQIVRGVESEVTRRGYHVILTHDHNDPELQIAQIRNMLNAQVSGLMLYPDRFVTERPEFLNLLQELKEKATPLVLLDRYVAGLDLPCVMTDNIRGMYEATEHLICCGRRRLALLGLWETNTVHADRRKGFIDALRDHGLPPQPVLEANVGVERFERSAQDIVTKWIANRSAIELPFDGIVCMNDAIAHGVYMALSEAGIRVPEDVAMVGYDNVNSELYQAMGLQLTTVEQPLEAMGTEAVSLLVAQIENTPRASKANHLLLPPKLMIRTSCGSKPRKGEGSAVPMIRGSKKKVAK